MKMEFCSLFGSNGKAFRTVQRVAGEGERERERCQHVGVAPFRSVAEVAKLHVIFGFAGTSLQETMKTRFAINYQGIKSPPAPKMCNSR